MSATVKDDKRLVLPRWRLWRVTQQIGDLSPIRSVPPDTSQANEEFDLKLSEWKDYQSISRAIDLVAAGFIIGRHSDIQEAAKQISDMKSIHQQESLSNLVASILHKQKKSISGNHESSSLDKLQTDDDFYQKHTKEIRHRLRFELRNAYLWVDLALHLTTLDNNYAAKRAITTALSLAPHDRFVLRSSARFFIHIADPERALHYLRKSPRTSRDPWLMASEISVTEALGRSSRLVKRGRLAINNSAFPAGHITELASAIATKELAAGKTKMAKNFFHSALEEPNDNTAAQVEWAGKVSLGLENWHDENHLILPRSFEARARDHQKKAHWEEAVTECESWLNDEPFSHEPAGHGSFLAGVALGDFKRSIRIAKDGLIANPDDSTIQNNLAFGYASIGDVENAERYHRAIAVADLDVSSRIAWNATGGLIEFRRKNYEDGSVLYQRAIDLAKSSGLRGMQILASIYHAREVMRIDKPRGRTLLEEIKQRVHDSEDDLYRQAFNLIAGRKQKIISQ